MDFAGLPNDIFLLILEYLSPRNLIALRGVSKAFETALSSDDLNRRLVFKYYPLSREARNLVHVGINHDWGCIFRKVVRRYHYLNLATPASVETFPVARSVVLPQWSKHYPIAPWRRYLYFEDRSSPFNYPDTLWTYDDGILIFSSTQKGCYAIFDLEHQNLVEIDIGSQDMIVRRISLKDKVLIVEWCEPQPYHQLNETEIVHRHFATAFDVIKIDDHSSWKVVFRNEWKFHFLGMALNSHDRFFSTHNSKTYALYLWQPNRSAWGEDEPLETLVVWNISCPSSYRPSNDPSGKGKPYADDTGPNVIRRLSIFDLEFYGIRQRETPLMQRLEVDDGHIFVVEENHRWMRGDHATFTAPRLHEVKCTGIPFHIGPHWRNSCSVDGDAGMSFCQRSSPSRQPHLAPCWRHEEFPYLTVAEVVDVHAGVLFSARQCFTLDAINIRSPSSISGEMIDASLPDEFWQQLLAKGKICGDERWLIGENNQNEVVVLYFDAMCNKTR